MPYFRSGQTQRGHKGDTMQNLLERGRLDGQTVAGGTVVWYDCAENLVSGWHLAACYQGCVGNRSYLVTQFTDGAVEVHYERGYEADVTVWYSSLSMAVAAVEAHAAGIPAAGFLCSRPDRASYV